MAPLFPLMLLMAQTAPAACPATPGWMPASLSAWAQPIARAPTIGAPFQVEGRDPTIVRGLDPGAVVRGGKAALVPIEITRPGAYRVALSDAAWVDIVRRGKSLGSVAHGHGPRCSGIRKIVDFQLDRGRYALQLSGMTADRVRVLIARG